MSPGRIMKEVSLAKEGEDSYIAFYRGTMVPLRGSDTIDQAYAELEKLDEGLQ